MELQDDYKFTVENLSSIHYPVTCVTKKLLRVLIILKFIFCGVIKVDF